MGKKIILTEDEVFKLLKKLTLECVHEGSNVKCRTIRQTAVVPCISHFTDENGNCVDLQACGVSVRLNKDGTHEYFRNFGYAGKMELTPVYVV